MTTINFPSSPAIGDTYSYLGKTWKWNGTGWIQIIVTPVINPSGTPKDGDIQVSGSVISIYASGAWRQVFPAVYS